MSGFKKCPSCFFKNAADAEACEQCTTVLTGITASGDPVTEAEDGLQSAEVAETPASAVGKSAQPLESAMPPPDPPAVTDDESAAGQSEESSPVESSTGPPPPPEDEDDATVESESTPPPAPPEEDPEPVADGSAGPPPPPPDEDEAVVESESATPPAPPEEDPELSAASADDGPPAVPDVTDTPPAPPAGQTMQPAKSGSKLKVIAIVAAVVILLSAAGVGAFALLNRGGTEVAVPEEQPEEVNSDAFDDPFNFDQNQAEFESPEHEDELLPETEPEEIPPADPPAGSGRNGTGSDTPSGQGGSTTPSGGNGSGGSILPIPIADIYIEPNNPTVDKTVIFSGAGSVSSNPNGIIRSYRWIFSDGVTGTGIAFQREFANSGLYVVELEVTDDQGKTGRVMDWVTVSAAGSGTSQTTPGGSQSSGTGGTESSTGNWWEVE